MYFPVVHPHLLYGIEIYGNTYPSYLSKLVVLNNKLLRIIQSRSIRTPVEDPHNTLPLSSLPESQVLVFIHKFIYNKDKLPVIFSSYFTPNSFIHSYDTRNKSDLHIESIQTAIVKDQLLLRYVAYGTNCH